MAQAGMASAAAGDGKAIVGYFEVHVRRDDRWMIDCTSRLADDALAEAAEIAKRGEVLAVRVIHERYNPSTDQSASRVIYDFAKPERRRGQRLVQFAQSRSMPAVEEVPDKSASLPAHHATVSITAHQPRPRPAPPSAPAPWTVFAWATLALATAATLLFVVLAIGG